MPVPAGYDPDIDGPFEDDADTDQPQSTDDGQHESENEE
jgi:hypothetical protein